MFTKITLKLYIQALILNILKRCYENSSHQYSPYQSIDTENIEPQNHIKPKILKPNVPAPSKRHVPLDVEFLMLKNCKKNLNSNGKSHTTEIEMLPYCKNALQVHLNAPWLSA